MSKYNKFLEKDTYLNVGSMVMRCVDQGISGEPLLQCDGSAISRTVYAKLFSLLGTTYGAGDGSTTFNLPDMRGLFLRGFDTGAGIDPDAGTRGATVGSYQESTIAYHTHTQTGARPSISDSRTGRASGGQQTTGPNNITGEMRPMNNSVKMYVVYKD